MLPLNQFTPNEEETCPPDISRFILFVEIFLALQFFYTVYQMIKKLCSRRDLTSEELKRIPTTHFETIYIKKWNHFGEHSCQNCKGFLNKLLLEHSDRIHSQSPYSANYIKTAYFFLAEQEAAYKKDNKKNQFIFTIYPAIYVLLIKHPKELIKFKEKMGELRVQDRLDFYRFLLKKENISKYKLDKRMILTLENEIQILTPPEPKKMMAPISSHQTITQYLGSETSSKEATPIEHKISQKDASKVDILGVVSDKSTDTIKNPMITSSPPPLPLPPKLHRVKNRSARHRTSSTSSSRTKRNAVPIFLEVREDHYRISNNFELGAIDEANRLRALEKKQQEKEQERLVEIRNKQLQAEKELKSIEDKRLNNEAAFAKLKEQRLTAERELNDLAAKRERAALEFKVLAKKRQDIEDEKRKKTAPNRMEQFALKVALALDCASSPLPKEIKTANLFEKHLLATKRAELINALTQSFQQEPSFGPIEEKELAKIVAKLNSLPTHFDFPCIDPTHSIFDAMQRMRDAGINIIFGGGGLLRDFLLQLDLIQSKRRVTPEEKKEEEYDVDLIISSDLEHPTLFKLLCGAFPKFENLSVKATEIDDKLYVYTVMDMLTQKKLYQIVNSPYFNLAKKTLYKNAPLLYDANHRDQVLNAGYYDQNRLIYTPLASTLIAIVCRIIHLIKKNDMQCFLRALISKVTLNAKSPTKDFHFSDEFKIAIPDTVRSIAALTRLSPLGKVQSKEFLRLNILLSTKVFCLPYLTTVRVFKLFTECGVAQVLFPTLTHIPEEKIKWILQKYCFMDNIYSEFLIAGNFSDLVSLCHGQVTQNRDFFMKLTGIIRANSILFEIYFDSNPDAVTTLLRKLRERHVQLPNPHSSELYSASTITFYGSSSSAALSKAMIPSTPSAAYSTHRF